MSTKKDSVARTPAFHKTTRAQKRGRGSRVRGSGQSSSLQVFLPRDSSGDCFLEHCVQAVSLGSTNLPWQISSSLFNNV
jgi:hypothetical protein